jgi:hypothetical protein
MASFGDTNKAFSAFDKELEAFEKECVRKTHEISLALIEALFSKTPVWSGETVRNYTVGVGRAAGGGTKTPVGSPGEYASEQARGPNESLARGDARAALTNKKLMPIVVSNNVAPDKWELIDSGNAPEPGRSRYPGAVALRAEQEIRARFAEDLE